MADDEIPGSVPATAPRANHEPGTISLRPVVTVLAALIVMGTGYAGYACLRDHSAPNTFTDFVSHYQPGSVTYLASSHSYLVRTPGGDILALSESEPDKADRLGGCVIRFRPEPQSSGPAGLFRDDCHGDLYAHDGQPLTAGRPPMQRHPVSSNETKLQVRFDVCLSGEDGNPTEACRA